MRPSKLAGLVLATCAALGLSASRVASAGALSTHPFICNLVRNTSPWDGISGATYSNATFTNSSGSWAIAMCSVPWQPSTTRFQVSTTSTATTCYLKTMSNGGVARVWTGTRSGNIVSFTTTYNSGTYAAEIECTLANGTGIYWLVNY